MTGAAARVIAIYTVIAFLGTARTSAATMWMMTVTARTGTMTTGFSAAAHSQFRTQLIITNNLHSPSYEAWQGQPQELSQFTQLSHFLEEQQQQLVEWQSHLQEESQFAQEPQALEWQEHSQPLIFANLII